MVYRPTYAFFLETCAVVAEHQPRGAVPEGLDASRRPVLRVCQQKSSNGGVSRWQSYVVGYVFFLEYPFGLSVGCHRSAHRKPNE